MSKFDTNGGYFAPQDYMRVNEGGSHEENPYGGVQVGVDPEGNPNLLEEGEPVYKDYVYSDNIEAEEQFLVDNNLPKKYAGKLYSKIADDLFSEAEERPLDPISRNGLEALLGRLADAQEGQKQARQQRELEDELANLSPEELDQLEMMLAQQEQPQMEAPAAPEQIVTSVEPMPQEQVTMPMMKDGGFLRLFDEGTPGRVVPNGASSGGGSRDLFDTMNNGDNYVAPQVPSLLEIALGPDNKIVQGLNSVGEKWDDFTENTTVGKVIDAFLPEDATQAFGSPLMRQAGRTLGPIGRSIGRGAKKVAKGIKNLPGKLVEAKGRGQMIEEAGAVIREAREASAAAKSAANSIAADLDAARASLKANPSDRGLMQIVADLEAKSAKADAAALKASARAAGATVEAAGKTVGAVTTGPLYNRAALEKEVDGLRRAYESAKAAADAAPKDKTLQEAAEAAQKLLEKAESGWNKWWNHGEWQYKGAIAGAGVGYGIASGKKKERRNWVENQLGEGGNLFLAGGPFGNYRPGYLYEAEEPYLYDPEYWNQADIPLTIKGTAERLEEQMRANAARDKAAERFSSGSTSGSSSTSSSRRVTSSSTASSAGPTPSYVLDTSYVYADGPKTRAPWEFGMWGSPIFTPHPASWEGYTWQTEDNENSGVVDNSSVSDGGVTANADSQTAATNGLLPTWPRYAGAVGSGLLGLYNAFQSPDRYTATRINPQVPEGRINLQNQVYNPIDQNMIANAQIAQGNATQRALRNSGMGPSTGAAILAADNNLTGNLGTGFIQAWDANNQRRSAVLAANNQAEAQRAQFDYTVDAARKQILNDAQVRNAQNNLLIQRLNNEAEGEKYASISNQIDAGLDALSGIGKENFAMNQINTNPAFIGYGTGANGGIYYNPITGRMEIIPRIPEGDMKGKPMATNPIGTPSFNFNYGKNLSLNEPTLFPGIGLPKLKVKKIKK